MLHSSLLLWAKAWSRALKFPWNCYCQELLLKGSKRYVQPIVFCVSSVIRPAQIRQIMTYETAMAVY